MTERNGIMRSRDISSKICLKITSGLIRDREKEMSYVVQRIEGPKGHTDMVRILIPGKNGKSKGGNAGTIGILGRLGGLGARPEQIGFVSDGDGALTALAVAAKLLRMQAKGDFLEGDVFVSTHV